MKITDTAYMTSVKDVAFLPALTPLEAAMLPAKMPRRMGALGHLRQKEGRRWQAVGVTGRKSGSGIHGLWR